MAPIANPVFQEADHPFLGDFREERADIEHEIHLLAADFQRAEGVQRIVLAAPRPEPIREPEEILLEDLAQNCRHRSLDDLVFERG